MRTSREERADLRARCKAGVIAITTDAALVAALVDDVEELDALVDKGARGMVELAAASTAEFDRLRAERDEARAERDAIALELSHSREVVRMLSEQVYGVYADLRAHAGKVAR